MFIKPGHVTEIIKGFKPGSVVCVNIQTGRVAFPCLCLQISALERDLVGLKSPSASDVAAVLDLYQKQVSSSAAHSQHWFGLLAQSGRVYDV